MPPPPGGFPLHTRARPIVIPGVRLVAAILLSASAAIPGAARDLSAILAGVEQRYNSARTMEARFEQRWLAGGRPRRSEAGTLKLLKPGKMRWDYSTPPGKLFLSDGKHLFYLSPATGKVERAPLKSADDFRTPLAFLLGKLNFKKTFQDFELSDSATGATVAAIPKGNRSPYSRVEFTVSPSNQITRLLVTSLDQTVMEFRFLDEKLNSSLDQNLFRFKPSPGVEMVDVKGFGETEAAR